MNRVFLRMFCMGASFFALSVPAFAATPTLDDIRITTSTLMPILDSIKDNFKVVLPVIIIVISVRVGAWFLPILVSTVAGSKR